MSDFNNFSLVPSFHETSHIVTGSIQFRKKNKKTVGTIFDEPWIMALNPYHWKKKTLHEIWTNFLFIDSIYWQLNERGYFSTRGMLNPMSVSCSDRKILLFENKNISGQEKIPVVNLKFTKMSFICLANYQSLFFSKIEILI